MKVADGKFFSNHECFSEELKEPLRKAEYSVNVVIEEWMLEILDEYFEILEEAGNTVIRI